MFPLQSEVTLLTDKDQAVPVQIVRTGLRSVIYGTPKGDTLDLRFVPISADVQTGDELVTSGLDGIYPPGLSVGEVVQVKSGTATQPHEILIRPGANLEQLDEVAVLLYHPPARPAPEQTLPNVDKTKK